MKFTLQKYSKKSECDYFFFNRLCISIRRRNQRHRFIVTSRQFAVTVMGEVFTVMVLVLPPV